MPYIQHTNFQKTKTKIKIKSTQSSAAEYTRKSGVKDDGTNLTEDIFSNNICFQKNY